MNKGNVVKRKSRKNDTKSGRPLIVNQNLENQNKFLNEHKVPGAGSYSEPVIDDSNKEDCIIKIFVTVI